MIAAVALIVHSELSVSINAIISQPPTRAIFRYFATPLFGIHLFVSSDLGRSRDLVPVLYTHVKDVPSFYTDSILFVSVPYSLVTNVHSRRNYNTRISHLRLYAGLALSFVFRPLVYFCSRFSVVVYYSRPHLLISLCPSPLIYVPCVGCSFFPRVRCRAENRLHRYALCPSMR